jgi:hypothetical protein
MWAYRYGKSAQINDDARKLGTRGRSRRGWANFTRTFIFKLLAERIDRSSGVKSVITENEVRGRQS